MAEKFPSTSITLISRLRDSGNSREWQVSWGQFHQIYHKPLITMAARFYMQNTGGSHPPQAALEDIVAQVVVDFMAKRRFDPNRGRLRNFLRILTHAEVVNYLRKEKPLNFYPIEAGDDEKILPVPEESAGERAAFQDALLASLIEDLKARIPFRSFEIFEMVKLKQIPPAEVAQVMGVHRRVVDNTVYKTMIQLREIAAQPEYQEEYLP